MKTERKTLQDKLIAATLLMIDACHILNDVGCVLNELCPDDQDDEPVYTPPKGCKNCPLKDFIRHD